MEGLIFGILRYIFFAVWSCPKPAILRDVYLAVPWVAETFVARFPVSVMLRRSWFGPVAKVVAALISISTENSRRTREKPLVPRVIWQRPFTKGRTAAAPERIHVFEWVGKSVIVVLKRVNRRIFWLRKNREHFQAL